MCVCVVVVLFVIINLVFVGGGGGKTLSYANMMSRIDYFLLVIANKCEKK